MAHMKALRWLQENPLIFQSLQAGAVMGTGDLISQKLIEKKETVDIKRLAAYTGFGLFIAGPVLSTWYRFLDKKLPFCWPRLKRSFVKMIADQTLMAPVYLAVFASFFEAIGGRTWEEFKEELGRKYTYLFTNNYKIWPAVQMLNFTLTPLQYQVLVVQLVSVAWNSYLSYKEKRQNGKEIQDKERPGNEKNDQDKNENKD